MFAEIGSVLSLKVFELMMFLAGNGGGWSINNVLNHTKERLVDWGSILIMVIGVVMIIVGIFKIAQALISHGKTQVNWVINILLIVIGALFCAGSVFFRNLTSDDANGVGAGIQNELENLGR